MRLAAAILMSCILPAAAQWNDASLLDAWARPGTAQGNMAASWTGRNGPAIGTGITFTANGQMTSIGAATNILQTRFNGTFQTNDSCSFSCWFSTTSTADVAVFGYNAGVPGTYLEFGQQATPRLWFWSCRDGDSSTADSVTMTNAFNDGRPHFVTVVYDGVARQLRFFVDGIASSNTTVGANSGSAAKSITNGIGIFAVSRPGGAPLRPMPGTISFPRVDYIAGTLAFHLTLQAESLP